MKILYSSQLNASLSPQKHHKKPNNIYFSGDKNKNVSSLDLSANYNKPFICRIAKKSEPKSFNLQKISSLNIPNFCITNHNGVRGETLSSPKNRKFLRPLKNNGISTIIDLREKYSSSKFEDLCSEYGFEYFKFPIDAFEIPDEMIIANLPKLFKLLNKGNYYIACAQGLHRTDIALAMNYAFNPEAKIPPFLIGHIRGDRLKTDDINRRLNSIYKNLSPDMLKNFGWEEYTDDTFAERKKQMYSMNREAFNLK